MNAERLLLAADIGATKCWLALVPVSGSAGDLRFARRYEDRAFASFADVLEAYLAETRAAFGTLMLAGACLAAAAPVSARRVRLTHRDWVIDADALAARFAIERIEIVNDFAAAAHGIEELGPGDLVTLQPGELLRQAPRVVIGAGTGLGVAYVLQCRTGAKVVAGEAGHMGFSPVTDLQAELWRFLHADHGRVSAEDVLSGRGLAAIHRFLLGGEVASAHDWNAASAVQRAAEAGDPIASRALDLFVEIYGSIAGDHALAVLARGGVYLAGGIGPRILRRLQSDRFLASFNDKREHAALARRMPVSVVINDQLAVIGAARLALDLYQHGTETLG